MVGRVNEIVKETCEAWEKLFVDKQRFFTFLEVPQKSNTPDIPVDDKGKGILGMDTSVLDHKLTKDISLVEPLVPNIEIPVDKIETI